MGSKCKRLARKKRKTSSDQNKALIEEVQYLYKEKEELSAKLKFLKNHSPIRETESDQIVSNLSRQLVVDHCEEALDKMNRMIGPVFDSNVQAIENIRKQLAYHAKMYRKHEDVLKNINRMEITCSLCSSKTDSLYPHHAVALPCGHIYGRHCIVAKLFTEAKCPKCDEQTRPQQTRDIHINPKTEYNTETQQWGNTEHHDLTANA